MESRSERRRQAQGKAGPGVDLLRWMKMEPQKRAAVLREALRQHRLDSDGYPAMVAAVEAFEDGQIDGEYAERAMQIATRTAPSMWDTTAEQLASILSMLFMFLDGRDMGRRPETLLLETFLWGFEAGWDWGKQFEDLGTRTESRRLEPDSSEVLLGGYGREYTKGHDEEPA